MQQFYHRYEISCTRCMTDNFWSSIFCSEIHYYATRIQLILITFVFKKIKSVVFFQQNFNGKAHSEWKFNIQSLYLLAATMSNVKNKNLFIMISQNLIKLGLRYNKELNAR